MKDIKKESLGLRIFLGSLVSEIEKLYGRPTLNAIIYRIGQKPGEIVSKKILEKYNRTEENPFEVPTAAFSFLENSITQLFDEEHIEYKKDESKNRYIIKIKNVCPLRQVIMSREDLEFGGTLCQFAIGYFETALKILTGMNVDYEFYDKETTDDYCMINIIFHEKIPSEDETNGAIKSENNANK
ncbi:MAG: hypothetical protein GY870_14185 [archaeon]|nr:hypothetical protein [archaeon]